MSRRAAIALDTPRRQLLVPGRSDLAELVRRVRLHRAVAREDDAPPPLPDPVQ